MRKSLFSARKNEMKNARKHNGGSKAGQGEEMRNILFMYKTVLLQCGQVSCPDHCYGVFSRLHCCSNIPFVQHVFPFFGGNPAKQLTTFIYTNI